MKQDAAMSLLKWELFGVNLSSCHAQIDPTLSGGKGFYVGYSKPCMTTYLQLTNTV